jgi:energy-coupling factor transporter ATP-binding protein EcfA2
MVDFKNPDQQIAYDFIKNTGDSIFLTGKAGTGKTTFLKRIKQLVPKRMVIVAPTGVAAINAGGVTIHSFFQLPFGPIVPHRYVQAENKGFNKKFSSRKIKIINSLDLLIVDEISMVRADILDAMDDVLRTYRDRSRPFGGVQLLLIGDLQQLAPVVKNDESEILKNIYTSPFFFNSKALQITRFKTVELKKIYRQSDDKFINILNKVRDNRIDHAVLSHLNERYQPEFNPFEEEGFIVLTTHNSKADKINESQLTALETRERVYKAKVEGDFPKYSFPTNEALKLKIGAQVMFVRNDYSPEKLYFNGKIGVVEELEDDTVFVRCDDDNIIEVNPVEWTNIQYSINEKTKEIEEEEKGKFVQFPLKLAWAITIHKSQGLTFEKAVIDARSAFAHGQVYVALSRCKTYEGMVLSSSIQSNSIKCDRNVKGFVSDYQDNPPTIEELEKAKVLFIKETISELFDFESSTKKITELSNVLTRNKKKSKKNLEKEFKNFENEYRLHVLAVCSSEYEKLTGLFDNDQIIKGNLLQSLIKDLSLQLTDALSANLIKRIRDIDLSFSNQSIENKANKIADQIENSLVYKESCFKACHEGFELEKYLKARSKARVNLT